VRGIPRAWRAMHVISENLGGALDGDAVALLDRERMIGGLQMSLSRTQRLSRSWSGTE